MIYIIRLHLFVSYSFVRTGYVSTTSSIETCTGKKNIIKATCKLVKGATYQVVKLIFLLERQSIEVNKKKKVGEGVSNKIHFALETVIMDSNQQTENKFPKYAQRLSFHDVFHITETVDLICPREV